MRQAITSRGIFQNSVVKESESIFMPFDNEVFILCVCVCVLNVLSFDWFKSAKEQFQSFAEV